MPLEGTRPLSRLKGKNSVTAQVVPQKAACGRARDRKANFSSANSPTDRLSEGVPGHHRGVPGQLLTTIGLGPTTLFRGSQQTIKIGHFHPKAEMPHKPPKTV